MGSSRRTFLVYAPVAGACALAAAVGLAVFTAAADRSSAAERAVVGSDLQADRRDGDLRAQRKFAWNVVSRLTPVTDVDAGPTYAPWHRVEDVFAPDARALPAGPARARPSSEGRMSAAEDGMLQTGEPQVIIFTLYNEAAFRHVRHNGLYQRAQLERLQATGSVDAVITANRTVPPFPFDSVVLLTAWWPVARNGVTALPVWDPKLNPPRKGGNNYVTWQRVVAIDPAVSARRPTTAAVDFAARSFPRARRVSLNAFHHVAVDQRMAKRIAADTLTRKAALIALGRDIEVGDHLALVAMHVATKSLGDWAWATLWWHDRADRGPFAQDRPAGLDGLWRNYLLDVAFDAQAPVAADDGPHISFNPWLEARFPDGGSGGGTVSNCVACHHRASFPAVSFLPVTRGTPDPSRDPAFAAGQLRTDFLWSVARRASAPPAHGTTPPEVQLRGGAADERAVHCASR